MADLPLTAWSGLAASLGAFNLPLADMRQDGAEVFVLDNACLRNLPQLVEGGVRQVEPTIADRQPAVGIIDHGDALARPRRTQEHDEPCPPLRTPRVEALDEASDIVVSAEIDGRVRLLES